MMKTTVAYLKIAGVVVGLVVGSLTVAGALGKLATWAMTRASAGEMTAVKEQQAADHAVVTFMAKGMLVLIEQNNHVALTGRMPYVAPPPAPPEVLGPAQVPGKSDAPR